MKNGLIEMVRLAVPALREVAVGLEEAVEREEGDWIVDMSAELPVNHAPDHPYLVERGWKWWPMRRAEDVEGITLHHTMSHSVVATAAYCSRSLAQGGKGYPSIQYHFWVGSGDGCPIFLCAPVEWALWHDHTGAHPKTISVGLDGQRHKVRPPGEQLEATARLVRFLMMEYGVGLEEVQGHNDRYRGTVCPGWDVLGWRDEFYGILARVRG